MQFRRMMLIPLALLFLTVGIAPIFTQDASAEVVIATPSMGKYLKKSRAYRHDANGLLQDPQDGDTVWVGHIVGNNDIFGGSGYGPYHVGRVDEFAVDPAPPFGHGNKVKTHPGAPVDKANNAYWDWDRWNAGEADSLQGWWPVTCPYGSVGGSNVPDHRRSFWGLDYGNVGNYVINQGAPKRTFGVRSYWHRDGGATQAPVAQPGLPASPQFDQARSRPAWNPLGGSFSAWCGLRAAGDIASQDATAQGGTGNYHNSDVLQYGGDNGNNQLGAVDIANGTDHLFPGYGAQWDQLMYRDFDLTGVAAASGATISFKYKTNMSTGAATASNISTGWYDKDPLSDARLAPPINTPTADGNFISAAAAAVIDSFMVYVGVPVEPVAGSGSPNPEPDQPRLGNDFVGSTGDGYEIHNVQHRWFSEVIAIDQTYTEILSTFGVNDLSAGVSIPVSGAIIDAIRAAGGQKIRVVFRVKTNRGFDDADNFQSTFDSGGEGAAIVDDVDVVCGSFNAPNGDGDFEQAADIDNSTGTAATAAWKTTGKAPLIYYHRHDVATLPYEDPCGTIGAANRQCNMRGGLLTSGNHDNKEKPGGVFGKNVQDNQKWVVTPTINLMSTGPGQYNGMGIDAEIADITSDIWLHFDVYTNGLQFGTTGNGLRVGWQSYPAMQANGVKTWGEMVKTIFFSAYDGAFGCGNDLPYAPAGALALTDGLIITTNTSGIPDSVRAYVEQIALCFRRPINATQCSPDIDNVALNGIYIDNASMGFIDGAEPPQLSMSVWDIYNSSFPWNDAISIGTQSFDTTTAHPRSGFQTGLQTGDLTRCTIPGDSIVVDALGGNTRVDLVFRILPGVGNYRTIGNRSSGLRKRPDAGSGGGNAATSGDGSFWGSYLGNRGSAGTAPGSTPHPGGVWSEHIWNSARADTAEGNLFPAEGVGNRPEWQLTPGTYVSSYHESEIITGGPRASLGICKNRCFLIDNTPGSALDNANVTCTSVPAWTSTVGSGYDAGEGPSYGCAAGQTKEYTKILPDGQFTPGTHVQYFWRKGDATSGVLQFAVPDTFLVFPQPFAGADFDGLRWWHFGVLPDRWKGDDLPDGGLGMACMLVVDYGNRRADELTWVQVADSIGLTEAPRRGAHNGWSARPDHDITLPITDPVNLTGNGLAVAAHGGQAGTVWDLYQVMGGESNVPAGLLGSRASGDCTGENGVSAKKQSTHGPDDEWLRGVYRVLVCLMTDLGQQAIGPVPDKSDQDVPLIIDFMNTAGGTDQPRGVMMIGRDFTVFNNADHPGFTATYFGGTARTDDYRGSSGSTDDAPDLIPSATLNSTGRIYGVFGPCFFFNDALNLDAGAAADGAEAAVHYENTGSGDPWIAGIYWPENAAEGHAANTFLGGWTFGAFGGFGGRFDLSSDGTQDFTLQALAAMFGDLCNYNPTPVGVGDGPNSGKPFVNFMNLQSENPMKSGLARIAFGIAKTERVEVKIYDVTGRLVKTVANKTYEGGKEHIVNWDGTDDHGSSVARGVYFYQLRTPSFVSQKKLAVLKN